MKIISDQSSPAHMKGEVAPRLLHPLVLPDYIVIDTCVLMSTVIRRLLLRLCAATGVMPLWTQEIHDEWLRNAPRFWKVDPSLVEKDWHHMQSLFPLAQVVLEPECLSLIRYTDKKDQHILAAALSHRKQWVRSQRLLSTRVGAWAVLTWNLKDFSRKELRAFDITLWNPDQFLDTLLSSYPEQVSQQYPFLVDDMSLLLKEHQSLAQNFRKLRLFKTGRHWLA